MNFGLADNAVSVTDEKFDEPFLGGEDFGLRP